MGEGPRRVQPVPAGHRSQRLCGRQGRPWEQPGGQHGRRSRRCHRKRCQWGGRKAPGDRRSGAHRGTSRLRGLQAHPAGSQQDPHRGDPSPQPGGPRGRPGRPADPGCRLGRRAGGPCRSAGYQDPVGRSTPCPARYRDRRGGPRGSRDSPPACRPPRDGRRCLRGHSRDRHGLFLGRRERGDGPPGRPGPPGGSDGGRRGRPTRWSGLPGEPRAVHPRGLGRGPGERERRPRRGRPGAREAQVNAGEVQRHLERPRERWRGRPGGLRVPEPLQSGPREVRGQCPGHQLPLQ